MTRNFIGNQTLYKKGLLSFFDKLNRLKVIQTESQISAIITVYSQILGKIIRIIIEICLRDIGVGITYVIPPLENKREL